MNGWSNHATWEVYTVISNTEWMYLRVQELIKKNLKTPELSSWIRSFYGDVQKVNWLEIAEAFLE